MDGMLSSAIDKLKQKLQTKTGKQTYKNKSSATNRGEKKIIRHMINIIYAESTRWQQTCCCCCCCCC